VKRRKFNKAEIAVFIKTVQTMAPHLGLLDWDIQIEQQDLGDRIAQVSICAEGRLAVIALSTGAWGRHHLGEEAMKRAACHELFHTFLADYEDLATRRFCDGSELTRENERMTMVMEKLLERLC